MQFKIYFVVNLKKQMVFNCLKIYYEQQQIYSLILKSIFQNIHKKYKKRLSLKLILTYKQLYTLMLYQPEYVSIFYHIKK